MDTVYNTPSTPWLVLDWHFIYINSLLSKADWFSIDTSESVNTLPTIDRLLIKCQSSVNWVSIGMSIDFQLWMLLVHLIQEHKTRNQPGFSPALLMQHLKLNVTIAAYISNPCALCLAVVQDGDPSSITGIL